MRVGGSLTGGVGTGCAHCEVDGVEGGEGGGFGIELVRA